MKICFLRQINAYCKEHKEHNYFVENRYERYILLWKRKGKYLVLKLNFIWWVIYEYLETGTFAMSINVLKVNQKSIQY